MLKLKLQKIIYDPYVLVSAAIGLLLMALTVYFRVNPVEGSVVHESIRGTAVHYLLLMTTMPAYIAGMLVGNAAWISYVLMFTVQAVLYACLGLLLRFIIRILWRKA